MLKKIALATLTAAALVAPPSLVHAITAANGQQPERPQLNGISAERRQRERPEPERHQA